MAPGTDTEGKLPPAGEGLDESGTSGWAAPPLPDSPSAPAQPPSSPSPGEVVAASATDGVAPESGPKIVEAPGVHAPRAEQLRAPTKVVIGIGEAPRRPIAAPVNGPLLPSFQGH